MRLVLVTTLTVCIAGSILAGPASQPTQPAQTDFAHAGIALSLPQDMQPRPVSEPFDVVRVVRMHLDKPVLAVTLSVFPAGPNVTADAYGELMLAELGKNLAIRSLELRSKTVMSVAGINAPAHLISYSFRGMKTTAARVYFMREIKKPELRLCYVLTVEAPADRESAIVPTLKEVAASVRLTDLRHLAYLPAALEVISPRQGFQIVLPLGWHVTGGPGGIVAGQTDYLLDAVTLPTASVISACSDGNVTPESAARKSLDAARAAAAGQDMSIEVLSQGEAMLAGVKGYQYELLQKPAPTLGLAGEAGRTLAVLQRTIVRPAEGNNSPRTYSLIVIARQEDRKAALALTDLLAENMKLTDLPPDTASSQPGEASGSPAD